MHNHRTEGALPARLSPRAGSGTRRALRRLGRSVVLQQSMASAFWPTVACSGLVVGLVLAVATRGQYVAWDGIHTIPAGGTR